MGTFIRGELPREEAIKLLTLQDVGIREFAGAWPAPRWIKVWEDGAPEAVMAWVNGAYADWFDVDPRVYIGKPDSVIWPADVCAKFRKLDTLAIIRAGEIVMDTEPTPRGDRGETCIARKFAFRIDCDKIRGWGIYGEICPLDVSPCTREGCPRG